MPQTDFDSIDGLFEEGPAKEEKKKTVRCPKCGEEFEL